MNGEVLDPRKVARRTNEVVGLTKQNLRNRGMSRTLLTGATSDLIMS